MYIFIEEQDAYLKKKAILNGTSDINASLRSQVAGPSTSYSASFNGFRSDSHTSKDNSKSTKDLKTLFRPPVEIMFKENWDAVCFFIF